MSSLGKFSMVRYRKEHHSEIHGLIVAAASRRLRSRGVDALNIAEVMKGVGLTHGGFYAHFVDRSAMICEALKSAMDDSADNFRMLTDMARQANRHSVIAEYYLSDGRVLDVENGCPAAALANEINRLPKEARQIFNDGYVATLKILTDYFGDTLVAAAALAQLIGSLNLMRVTESDELRVRIKQAAVLQFERYPPAHQT
jgi:TetR/AcrR family transcriptional regulator, transcriptional repressor for nem operon